MASANSSRSFMSFTLLLSFTIISIFAKVDAQNSCECFRPDVGPVVSTTPLVSFLELVQDFALKTFGHNGFDPKVYVDMSLKQNLTITSEAFKKIIATTTPENGSVSASEFNGFLAEYLKGVDEDLVYVEPEDFVAVPDGFLPKVENAQVRAWAIEVHSLWKNLSRKVSETVLENPESYTLLPLQKPVIIPGSRFREVYYWDSYWIIRGLLPSKMFETAKGMVTNLISLIDEFGYVLNGARAYYTNRSQPPLLSSMIFDIYNRTTDKTFVNQSLPALLKEHKFWNSGIHKVTIQDAQGSLHNLSRYYAMWNKPRPESSTIDRETASKLSHVCEKTLLYRELASAAESGWDFSTRWLKNASDLATMSTTSILPVDLNAFILKMELDIAFLANVIGENSIAQRFTEAAQARHKAMNTVFWNDKKGQWFDYWLTQTNTSEDVYKWEASNQNQNSFASNFMPLWINLFHSDTAIMEKAIQSFQTSGLLCPAGIATSLTNTGQQWDFPNGWAPLQHMIAEGLATYGSQESKALAKEIAFRWIRTNHAAYKKTGTMHEKYDVQECGAFGGGGEYDPQTGFGWSNGVVLAFLEEFGWPEDLKIECNQLSKEA